MTKRQADNLIKRVETARAELIEYIHGAIKENGFNRVVETGVSRETLARFQKKENITIDTLLKMKKCIDKSHIMTRI
ncbi:MAG: hypothetical protein ABIJ97_03175 [Bacteroidota bacterium]